MPGSVAAHAYTSNVEPHEAFHESEARFALPNRACPVAGAGEFGGRMQRPTGACSGQGSSCRSTQLATGGHAGACSASARTRAGWGESFLRF